MALIGFRCFLSILQHKRNNPWVLQYGYEMSSNYDRQVPVYHHYIIYLLLLLFITNVIIIYCPKPTTFPAKKTQKQKNNKQTNKRPTAVKNDSNKIIYQLPILKRLSARKQRTCLEYSKFKLNVLPRKCTVEI